MPDKNRWEATVGRAPFGWSTPFEARKAQLPASGFFVSDSPLPSSPDPVNKVEMLKYVIDLPLEPSE